MKLDRLILKGEHSSPCDISGIEIKNVTASQIKINSGTLFVFIKSIKFDVRKIINGVLALKPAAILCDEDFPVDDESIPIIKCKNTRKLLPYIYARFYGIDFDRMRFVGITGTNGKTTTATMLTRILSNAGKRVGFIGTGKITVNGKLVTDFDYSMTTPDPEYLYYVIKEMQDAGCEYVIMEVSSHALYFEKTAPILFEVAIFTNLSEEHLDFHKSKDEYFDAKMKLFSRAKLGIFNADDNYSKRAYMQAKCKKICIGILKDADAMAKEVVLSGLSSSEYIYREKSRLFKVNLNLGGAFNVYNSMMATAAALSLGISPNYIKETFEKLDLIDGRLEIIKDEITVIIDYAHTSEAFENLLKLLYSAKSFGQNIITVFGCGGERDKEKRPKMARVAEKYSDLVIVTGDNSREESEIQIIKDILSGFDSTENRKVIASRKAAIEHAIASADKGDIVAIIGKGHERYIIDKNGAHPFDERTVIKEALKKRKRDV